MNHGERNAYERLKCRCPQCRAGNARRHLELRNLRHERMLRGEVNPEHGKSNTYINYACRCEPCRKAETIQQGVRRANRNLAARIRRGV